MKCPTCLSTMECISEIHAVPGQPGRQRMDLHCAKHNPTGFGRGCESRCYMGVITEDPKEWVCHEYSFSFWYRKDVHQGNHYYILSSYNYLVDPMHQNRPYVAETILSGINGDIMVLPYFTPISTGDDMHERALFHRFMNIVAFS